MRSSLFLTAAMAMAVAASPALKIVEEVVTKTVTLKPGQHAPTAAPKPVAPAPKPAPAPAKPAANNGGGFLQGSHPAPAAAPADSGNDYLDVANKYRAMYGLPLFSWDASMLDNCASTGGNGITEKHVMIPGKAMGQVITPGQKVCSGNCQGKSPFELAYAAWLCEVHDPQLGNVCNIVQSVITMNYGGDTGHHDILVNPAYTKIACAFTPQNGQLDPSAKFQGLYVCDVAQ